MMSETSKIEIDDRGVATLTMTRGDMHNAFDDVMIAGSDSQAERTGKQ